MNQWQAQLDEQAAAADKLDPAETWKAHCQWWADFWQRSRIVVAGCEPAKTITQGYALERFVQACASRGAFPMLFNGSIFTMDMPAGTYAFGGPRGAAVNADHRDWERPADHVAEYPAAVLVDDRPGRLRSDAAGLSGGVRCPGGLQGALASVV